MKCSICVSAGLLGLLGLTTATPLWTGDDAEERKAVTRAVLDYCEAFYEAKPELLERSVHPELTKLGYWRQSAEDEYQEARMSFEQAVALAKRWNADGGQLPEDAPKKVEILDVMDQTASAKLTAHWGVDYFHLARYEGKWMIIQVLWQSHPPEQAQAGDEG